MNDLIRDNLKEIVNSVFLNWMSIIMSKNLEKFIILVNITYLLFFSEIYMKNICQWKLEMMSKVILPLK